RESRLHRQMGARGGAGAGRDEGSFHRGVRRGDPRNADSLLGLGALCLDTGRAGEAETLFRALASVRPGPDCSYHLGLALTALERAEAEAAYRQALVFRPDFPEALCNLGAGLNAQGRLEEAGRIYRRVLTVRPDHAEALSNLALIRQGQGMIDRGVAALCRALAVQPGNPDILHNLALALDRQRRPDEAAAAARRAVAVQPFHAEALSTLGTLLRELDRLPSSILAQRNAIILRPAWAEALNNLGNSLHDQGRLDEAVTAYDRAVASRPDFTNAHWNRALSRLLGGDFSRGWDDYEWRLRQEGNQAPGGPFPQPLWRGEEPVRGTLLVHTEQGFGDTIQFIRYVPAAVARGWRVVVEAPRPLLRLLGSLPVPEGRVTLVAKGEPLPPFDAHCPLLSLPRAFRTEFGTIPAPIPYLKAEPDRVEAWARRLPPRTVGADGPGGLRVGIVWQGNPQAAVDRGRSVPLAEFAPLARIPGLRLVSLQKNHGLEQLDRLPEGMAVTVLGPGFDDGPHAFRDTAAVMMGLDLIVTTDTAVAHLAGALGRPVWLALKAVPDWRWLMGREDCPWYPTMRLFRQTRPGDWRPVVARMAGELFQIMMAKAMRTTDILVETAPGELLDKISILEIKRERIQDPVKRRNVETEHGILTRTADRHIPSTAELRELAAALKAVNTALWEIEDAIRDCERAQDFGPRFIELARAVYRTNDRRAAIKRQINERLGSALFEEKSYAAY
ncbi:DUF6165 family protein, partial [Azospirillum brasilense]|uniref:DUF6165 family protein n=1 Tax=Azospirillum brasilense TaxID=192 RepID=UPI001B3BE277